MINFTKILFTSLCVLSLSDCMAGRTGDASDGDSSGVVKFTSKICLNVERSSLHHPRASRMEKSVRTNSGFSRIANEGVASKDHYRGNRDDSLSESTESRVPSPSSFSSILTERDNMEIVASTNSYGEDSFSESTGSRVPSLSSYPVFVLMVDGRVSLKKRDRLQRRIESARALCSLYGGMRNDGLSNEIEMSSEVSRQKDRRVRQKRSEEAFPYT